MAASSGISAAQLDDLVTRSTIDSTFMAFTTRKLSNQGWLEKIPNTASHDEKKCIVEYARKKISIDAAVQKIASYHPKYDDLTLRRFLKQYISMYEPQCSWEIVPTARYGNDRDSCIRARSPIAKGERISGLQGCLMSCSSATDADGHISLMQREGEDDAQVLMGPIRFANHHCQANARFQQLTREEVGAIAIESIAVGEEITMVYADNYFGPQNQDCRCSGHDHASPSSPRQQDRMVQYLDGGHGFLGVEVLMRHQDLYGLEWPKTRDVAHSRSTRASRTLFDRPELTKSPPRIRRKFATLTREQMQSNTSRSPRRSDPSSSRVQPATLASPSRLARRDTTLSSPSRRSEAPLSSPARPRSEPSAMQSPIVANPTTIPAAAVSRIICFACDQTVKNKPNHISKHIYDKHGMPPTVRGTQEQCPTCEIWHGSRNRGQHYKAHHPDEAVPGLDDVVKMNPLTLQYPLGKRPFGPRSKRFPRRIPAEDSSDEDDESATVHAEHETAPPISAQQTITPVQQFMAGHEERVAQAASHIETTVGNFQAKVRAANKKKQESLKATMYHQDMPQFWEMWERRRRAQMIDADTYRDMYAHNSFDDSYARYSFTVCTSEEARSILDLGRLKTSLVVPASAQPETTRETFLQWLAAADTVEMLDMDKALKSSGRLPRLYQGHAAAEAFDQSGRHYNILNLVNQREQPTPQCMHGLKAFTLLSRLPTTGLAGKSPTFQTTDFESSKTFGIASSEGVWSSAHRDRYGLLTTAFVEFGSKLWITYPELTDEEEVAWGSARGRSKLYPAVDPFPICLRTGDLLIQASRTVHAPWTLEDCLLSGTQHLDSRLLPMHVEAALSDLKHPHTTNENPAIGAIPKFIAILQQIDKGNKYWPWPDLSDVKTFVQLLEVLIQQQPTDSSQSPTCHCTDCETDIFCPCMSLRKECSPNCHKVLPVECTNPYDFKEILQAVKDNLFAMDEGDEQEEDED